MKIFVSGATGSIGSQLVKMLSERGYTIHILVRSLEKAAGLDFPNIVPFLGDITDKTSVDNAMKGCENAYHLAAFVKVWSKDSGEIYKINVGGTVNVLQSAVDHQVKKVVVTSSAGIYGPSLHGIINEDKIRDIDILNEYEGSKIMAESKVKDFVNIHNLNIVIVSPTRVYGPFLFGKPISANIIIDKYLFNSWRIFPGTGKEVVNYAYVKDVALGHILAMKKGLKGQTYLLGGVNCDGETFFKKLSEVTEIKRRMIKVPYIFQMAVGWLQLLSAMVYGKEPVITPKWVKKGFYSYELSSDKAIKELGLTITPLEQGLKETIECLRDYHEMK